MEDADLDRREQIIMQNIAKKQEKERENDKMKIDKESSSSTDKSERRRRSRWDDTAGSGETPKYWLYLTPIPLFKFPPRLVHHGTRQ